MSLAALEVSIRESRSAPISSTRFEGSGPKPIVGFSRDRSALAARSCPKRPRFGPFWLDSVRIASNRVLGDPENPDCWLQLGQIGSSCSFSLRREPRWTPKWARLAPIPLRWGPIGSHVRPRQLLEGVENAQIGPTAVSAWIRSAFWPPSVDGGAKPRAEDGRPSPANPVLILLCVPLCSSVFLLYFRALPRPAIACLDRPLARFYRPFRLILLICLG